MVDSALRQSKKDVCSYRVYPHSLVCLYSLCWRAYMKEKELDEEIKEATMMNEENNEKGEVL